MAEQQQSAANYTIHGDAAKFDRTGRGSGNHGMSKARGYEVSGTVRIVINLTRGWFHHL